MTNVKRGSMMAFLERRNTLGLVALALTLAVGAPAPTQARPLYFQTFTGLYGLVPGNDLYACGVCHRLWTGTGARNPFGVAVEQQLYVGKTITDAILTVAPLDTDGDGFSNGDEIAVHGTLPGYSCSNYELATNPPSNFQSLITPGVPTCLLPLDIAVVPTSVATLAEVGKSEITTVLVSNHGSVSPVTLSGASFLAGTNAAFSLTAPVTPVVIPLGGSVNVDVTFTPSNSGLANGTLRVTSDDPDEPIIDVALSGVGFVRAVAPAGDRAACQKSLERETERYTKAHLREWSRCYLDELGGLACDAAARDRRLARAEARLRAKIGGSADRACAPRNLTPSRLGMASTCGGTCATVPLGTLSSIADCVTCRQDAVRNEFLEATVGSSPPDLPSNGPGAEALRCNQLLSRLTSRGVSRMQKALGKCALANVTAAAPVDCASQLAPTLTRERDLVNLGLEVCTDTTGLLGCPFVPLPNATCLGTSAESIATSLVATIFPDL